MAFYVGKMSRASSHISVGGMRPRATALERNEATLGQLDDQHVYSRTIPSTEGYPRESLTTCTGDMSKDG